MKPGILTLTWILFLLEQAALLGGGWDTGRGEREEEEEEKTLYLLRI